MAHKISFKAFEHVLVLEITLRQNNVNTHTSLPYGRRIKTDESAAL